MKEKGFYLQQESGEFVFLTEGDLHKASDYYYIYKLTEYLLNSSTNDLCVTDEDKAICLADEGIRLAHQDKNYERVYRKKLFNYALHEIELMLEEEDAY